jgi:tetratricopeptide (TPR) repeat protein
MHHHILATSTPLAPAFIGTILPILALSGPDPSVPRSGEGPELEAIVQRALRAAKEIDEGQDKVFVLLDLARFQLRTGARESAKEATRQAIESGRAIREPLRRARTLTECCRAQAEIGDQASARELLQEPLLIVRDLNRRFFPSQRPPPGTRPPDLLLDPAHRFEILELTEVVARALAELGDCDQAFQIIDGPSRHYPTSIAVGRIIWSLKGKDHDTVRLVSERAVQVAWGFKDPTSQSAALESIAIARARLGDFDGATETADLLGSLARVGAVDPKYRGLRNYQDEQAAVLSEVARARAEVGDREGAEKSRETARQIVLRLAETSPVQLAFAPGSVPLTLARVGEIPRAIRVANSIRDPTMKFFARTDVAIAQAKAGDREAARRELARVFHEVSQARLTSDKRRLLYAALTRALAGVGDVPLALRAAAALKEAGPGEGERMFESRNHIALIVRSQSENLARAYAEIAKVQAEAGDFGSALKTADLIPSTTENTTKADALEIIARVRAKAGDAKGAIDEASGARSPLVRARTLLGVAQGIHERQTPGEQPNLPAPRCEAAGDRAAPLRISSTSSRSSLHRSSPTQASQGLSGIFSLKGARE